MAEEHRRGPPFKMILALLLLLGIVGLIFYANFGANFGGILGSFAANQKQPSEPFAISLSTGINALYGKSFSVTNSAFTANGVCSSITINGLKIDRSEPRCSVSSGSFTGNFQYTQFGSIIFSGSSSSLTLDANKISGSSPDSQVTFSIEIIPSDFTVGGITAKTLSFVAPSGQIQKFDKDGSLKGIAYLSKSTLDITNLIGRVELTSGQLKVTGTATSVKSQDFSW